MLVCVYDTETTDLPSNWASDPRHSPNEWPHIIQLAWMLVDTEDRFPKVQWSNLVQLRPGVRVNRSAQAVHGISRAEANKNGVTPQSARLSLLEAIDKADLAVCHNVDFDRRVMLAEACRSDDTQLLQVLNKPHFCTMLAGVDLCKIPGKYGMKWPKLNELHLQLIGEEFTGAHDALSDVMACARCFLWMEQAGLVRKKKLSRKKR